MNSNRIVFIALGTLGDVLPLARLCVYCSHFILTETDHELVFCMPQELQNTLAHALEQDAEYLFTEASMYYKPTSCRSIYWRYINIPTLVSSASSCDAPTTLASFEIDSHLIIDALVFAIGNKTCADTLVIANLFCLEAYFFANYHQACIWFVHPYRIPNSSLFPNNIEKIVQTCAHLYKYIKTHGTPTMLHVQDIHSWAWPLIDTNRWAALTEYIYQATTERMLQLPSTRLYVASPLLPEQISETFDDSNVICCTALHPWSFAPDNRTKLPPRTYVTNQVMDDFPSLVQNAIRSNRPVICLSLSTLFRAGLSYSAIQILYTLALAAKQHNGIAWFICSQHENDRIEAEWRKCCTQKKDSRACTELDTITARPSEIISKFCTCSTGYIALERVLPCCRVLIHHGGSGTTLAAALSGTPQIITPGFFDQFDWARQVEKLQVGVKVSMKVWHPVRQFDIHRSSVPNRLQRLIFQAHKNTVDKAIEVCLSSEIHRNAWKLQEQLLPDTAVHPICQAIKQYVHTKSCDVLPNDSAAQQNLQILPYDVYRQFTTVCACNQAWCRSRYSIHDLYGPWSSDCPLIPAEPVIRANNMNYLCGTTVLCLPGTQNDTGYILNETLLNLYFSEGPSIQNLYEMAVRRHQSSFTVVDVGASIGLFTIAFAAILRRVRRSLLASRVQPMASVPSNKRCRTTCTDSDMPGIKIHAFEPSSFNCSAFNANCLLHDLHFNSDTSNYSTVPTQQSQSNTHVSLIQAGIATEDSELVCNRGTGKHKTGILRYYSKIPGNSSLLRDQIDSEKAPILLPSSVPPLWRNEFVDEEVSLISLNTWMTEASTERIDFLKIDVEGSEIDVLRSLSRTNWKHVRHLVCEVNPPFDRIAQILRFLKSQSIFSVFTIKSVGLYCPNTSHVSTHQFDQLSEQLISQLDHKYSTNKHFNWLLFAWQT